ncbi:MAG: 50S ribosomal protein L11 methyltransferase [Myxococcota bacterium]
MDLQAFGDLWEHVRLLSDARRNDALLALLARRAPGARVLEIGCGSGLLSCVAARLGARRVVAVEPTEQADTAQALVEANGLGEVVEVVQAHVEELDPEPVDLAVSELLNAEPLAEGLFDAMDAAAPWIADGGRLAPRRLRLWVALVRDRSSAVEVRDVRRQLAALQAAHGLDLSPILDGVDALEPYRFFSPQVQLASAPACIADLASAPARAPRSLPAAAPAVHDPGPVGGATVWFEAEYRRRARPRQRARPARPLGPPRARLARGARCVRHLRRGRPHRRRGDRRHPATTATSR